VRFDFIRAEKAHFPIALLCDVLGVSRSGYYAYAKRPPSPRARADARLAVEITAAHARSRRTYGSPRVHVELKRSGFRVGEKRVARLMREHGLVARSKRRFRRTTDSNHKHPPAPNVLARVFKTAAPNEAWVADVTYLDTAEGWAYLAVIVELYSRRVVGFAVSAQNDTALVLTALRRALGGRRPPAGLVHHSDRGSTYASAEYQAELAKHGLVASMSRKGDCWDNAVVESFFATLRAELVDHERYPTRAHAAASVGEYIEGFYNVQRRHSTLGYLSPVEFELRGQVAAMAA
jgi:putative transposase